MKAPITRFYSLAFSAAFIALSAGAPVAYASSLDDEYAAYAETADTSTLHDPFENTNRVIFNFNEAVDNHLTEPLAKGYRATVHKTYRGMIGNMFRNLRQPSSALNHLLQGDPENAGHALWSFLIDTAVGGGALGITEAAGTMPHREDFNQTLAVWGVPSGPYLMLPFIGPSSVRGFVGLVADRATTPDYILLHGEEIALAAVTTADIIQTRYEFLPVTEALEENAAFDLYSSYKSAYTQNMNKKISE